MSSFDSKRGPPEIDGMTSLKVDNLTYRTTIGDLEHVFSKYGELGDVYIPRDRYKQESRGFAFIRFYERRDAEDAMDALHGKIIDGREIRVQMAKYGRPTDPYKPRNNRYKSSYNSSRYRSRSRSPRRSYRRSRSRSPRRRSRSRSRSPRRTRHSNSRSPKRNDSRSRSKSPRRKRSPSRSRSKSGSKPRQSRSRSKSHSRSPKDRKSRSHSNSPRQRRSSSPDREQGGDGPSYDRDNGTLEGNNDDRAENNGND